MLARIPGPVSILPEQRGQAFEEPLAGGAGFQGAGPDGDDVPAEVPEFVLDAEVAGAVAVDLGAPPLAAGRGQAEVGALRVPVPEAAVDEDHGPVFRQHQFGPAGELAVPRAGHGEAVAGPVEHRAQGDLGPGVAAADARHHLGSLFGSEDVGHRNKGCGQPAGCAALEPEYRDGNHERNEIDEIA